MISRPVAIGLTLCDYVIVEARTGKVSLIGTFKGIAAHQFPAGPQPFCVFAVLTDAVGDATIEIVISRLDTGEAIFENRTWLKFPDKLTEVEFFARLRQCSFPVAGTYQVTLLVDGEWVAQRRLQVYLKEG